LKELKVYLKFSKTEKIFAGTLAESENRIFFEYAASFLSDPLWLSPYKLPPKPGLFEHKDKQFGSVFGLFDDSLPDGWGLLLMDRFLRKQGVDIDRLSVMDRLSFLGEHTMGALIYEPAVKHVKTGSALNLEDLARHSRQILEGETIDVLPELMKAGGSPGGARPKILAGVKNNTLISDKTDLPQGFEHWMIKFNSTDDFPDAGAVEYAYAGMAKQAGIIMPETRLFEVNSQDRYFGIKRFDRENNRRFHVHTFGNLIHSNFRYPECDYETFLKVVLDLTKNHKELEKGFRQMIFNVMVNNRDDHVKNFAFMLNENREWTLTPAYDLTYAKGPGGEHSMSLAGEGSTPGKKEILRLGEKTGLSPARVLDLIEEVKSAVESWKDFAKTAEVTKQTRNQIEKKIKENLFFF
jgi:serine/threonine-protein kinase HipA